MSEYNNKPRYFKYETPEPGEEVVISGLAGRFPEADNLYELRENLFNYRDCITDDDRRWALDHPEIPKRHGKVNNIKKFDASYFNINYKQAHTMDPLGRMLLEHAYEAIVDAGINPEELRGKKVSVIVGSCFSETEKTWYYEKMKVNGYGIMGCSRSMLANRISQWLGVTGLSYSVDTACSSSLYAMEHAYKSLRSGQSDYAIVGGCNICIHPFVSLQFSRLGVLSRDGKCKCFDKDANGYARSESVVAIFLQKSKNAKRIYATVSHAKSNCDGYKEEGITFPSSDKQSILLQEFYEECGIPTEDVNYIEAHGTGTRVGDPEELNAIDKIFCKNRSSPLKVGSIKSNVGHTEPASGVVSIAKTIIAFETGIIPPNNNLKNLRDDVECFNENRISIVTEPTPLEGSYIGVNSFGFGGANCHVLLQLHPKTIKKELPNDDLPRLVAVSGRTEEAVESLLNSVNQQPINVEFIGLFHNIYRTKISGHLYRGYTIANFKPSNKNIMEIEKYSDNKRPICFVFSGLGSNWPGMGQAMMRFAVFAKAIEKCDAVLKPRKLNIYDILTNKNSGIFDNVLHSSVGIAALQIGLVDLLTTVGIIPDYIIGHFIGELGCAYADKSLTAEEVILAAYSQGIALIEAEISLGSMAVIEIDYKNVKQLCPADIDVVADNGSNSSIVSGPIESIKAFVKNLQANKISVNDVSYGNVLYHSRYVAPAGTKLLSYLKKVIPVGKPRSEKWLSTSVPHNKWSTSTAQLSSAEYHTNSLLKPVFFEEISALIPDNAVTIEIAPHDLLSTILNKSLKPTVTNIALIQKDHKDNVEVFLQGLGKLHNIGQQLDLAKLYPPIEFPVSRGTPMISPLVRWDHSKDWFVSSFKIQERIVSGERTVNIKLIDEDYEYIAGHDIDGRNLFPATGYLCLVWETMGMMIGELYTEVSVVFSNIQFKRATNIPKEGMVELLIMIQKGTGNFEVTEGDTAIVSGNIRVANDISKEKIPDYLKEGRVSNEKEILKRKDIYKELRLRGYQYSGLFRSIVNVTTDGKQGYIEWKNNWIAFMDNLLQFKMLACDTRSLSIPIGIKKLIIDSKYHQQYIRTLPLDQPYIPAQYLENFDVIIGGGIEVHKITTSIITRKKPIIDLVIEEYKFVAHRDKDEISLRDMLTFSVHICLENIPKMTVKTIEFIDENDDISVENLVSPMIFEILTNLPLIQANINILAPSNKFTEAQISENITVSDLRKIQSDDPAILTIGYNLLSAKNKDKLKNLTDVIKPGYFILSRENTNEQLNLSILKEFQLGLIAEKHASDESYVLLRKLNNDITNISVVHVDSNKFNWLQEINTTLEKKVEESNNKLKIILVEEGNFESGLLGFVNCLHKEPGYEMCKAVLIQDPKAPKFSLDLPLYSEQLDLNLAINVLRSGNVWGSYRHFLLPPPKMVDSYHAIGTQLVRGDLSSLNWIAGSYTAKDKDLTKIYYSSLNFKDVMLASGKLAPEILQYSRKSLEHLIGFEYSGINAKGQRIMGQGFNRCISNYVKSSDYSEWVIPENWSLEDAATVPCIYCTCISSFYLSANIQKGDSILIHAGSGGIGQAAINLALYEGCEVFVTVGTQEKRIFIKRMFPSIDDNHIGCSRDISFEQMILRETNGRGVDIVLNSLAEDKLQASLRCLAYGGRFVEIGKVDIAANNIIDAELFKKNISFHSVMLDRIINTKNKMEQKIYSLMRKLIINGAIKPIVRTIFQKEQLEEAIRFMASGKHVGKVIIQIRKENDPPNMPISTIPSYMCIPDKSYIIIGGLGGFGLELIDWLILREATNIVITSRSGIKNGYQHMRIKTWKTYGINIKILNLDAAKREDCELLLKTAMDLGPVDAIFNLAVSLKDAAFKNQTVQNFEESFKGKAWSTKNLDEISRKLCPDLRHFVVFSSVSCGRGNAGQTNYGMANSVMERICEKRVEEGFPGLAIQWGAIGEVGLVAEMQEDDKEMIIGGTLQQKISSCLEELNKFLLQDKPIVASMVVAEKRLTSYGANNCVTCVLNIMGIKDLKTVNQQTSLAELGMDSMMAIEIKQSLEREFDILLTAQDIRSLNFGKLIEMNTNKDINNNKDDNVEEKLGIGHILFQLFGEKLNKDFIVPLNTNPEEGRKEVFFLPGIEGYSIIFKNLGSKIKLPAISFQLPLSTELTSIKDIANFILPHILERLKDRQDFAIVGYSYGSLISVELVRQLELRGFNGKLILIDGAPLQMKKMMNQYISTNLSEQMLQDNILISIMDSLDSSISAELANKLLNTKTWEEKVNECVNCLPRKYKKFYDDQDCKIALTLYYLRIQTVIDYNIESSPFLKSPIVLCKPTLNAVHENSYDHGIKSLTEGKIRVYTIEGDHVTILENIKLANAINDELIENFENTT